MDDKVENFDNIINYWLDSADQNYTTMQNLFNSKDYSWALFLGHLLLEKTLKAIYVKKFQKHAIFTHDLLRLAKKVDLRLNEDQEEWLDEITTFNINARYDNYKKKFNKLCTRDFTQRWINIIIELRQWLIKQL